MDIRYPDFRDQNATTGYPFAERAKRINDAGDMILEGFLLDAHLYPIGGQERLYLSKVIVAHETITFYIGDASNDELASGEIPTVDPLDCVRLVDTYGRPAGILVSESERLAVFQTWGIGTHEFTVDQTEFCATCCMPTPEIGLRGIQLEDGTLFTGHVWIVGDDGVVVRQGLDGLALKANCIEVATTIYPIRIDIVGDPLFRRRLCADTGYFSTPNPVRVLRITDGTTSHDCVPDEFGNLTIQMNDNLATYTALRIRVQTDGIKIETVGSSTSGA